MMGKGLGVIWGVLLIGGVLGSGLFDSNRPRRSLLRIVFLLFRTPFQAQPMVRGGYFSQFDACLCGIVVQYRLRPRWPGSNPGGVLCLLGVLHSNACVVLLSSVSWECYTVMLALSCSHLSEHGFLVGMHLSVTVSLLEVGFVRIPTHEGWIHEGWIPMQSGPQSN